MQFRHPRSRYFIQDYLRSLYPENHIKLADMASMVRMHMYPHLPVLEGTKRAYRRICVDFKDKLCVRAWGYIDDKQLVKMDGNDNWVYLAWISSEEIRKIEEQERVI